jgi:hypothetical protein
MEVSRTYNHVAIKHLVTDRDMYRESHRDWWKTMIISTAIHLSDVHM